MLPSPLCSSEIRKPPRIRSSSLSKLGLVKVSSESYHAWCLTSLVTEHISNLLSKGEFPPSDKLLTQKSRRSCVLVSQFVDLNEWIALAQGNSPNSIASDGSFQVCKALARLMNSRIDSRFRYDRSIILSTSLHREAWHKGNTHI